MAMMQDPITEGAAVLVKRYNITQGKELELKLAEQQLVLQRSASDTLQQSAMKSYTNGTASLRPDEACYSTA